MSPRVPRILVIGYNALDVTVPVSGLPEPEDVMESFHLVLDSQPALLVTTKEAGKLGLFAEKRVRLYKLEEDRSRAGRRPILAAVSNMNIWQEASAWVLDINQEGSMGPHRKYTCERPPMR